MTHTTPNYVLIVADSTRYDTAREARLPFLNDFGQPREAWAHATFTWPSHMAMMVGMLPHVRDLEPLYNRYCQQLWRLGSDRGTGGYPDHPYPAVGLDNDCSIVHGFRSIGYRTVGTGGLSWFRHPVWMSWFDDFRLLDRADLQVAWAVEVTKSLEQPFFLFINLRETHEPYSFGDHVHQMPEGYQIHKLGRGPLTPEQFGVLRERQIAALEYVDGQLYSLFNQLPSNTLTVFTSDHGECFGEDGFFGHGFYHPVVMQVPLLIFST